MIAKELMSIHILPLKTSDTGDYALLQMSENYIKDLPIVNNRQFLGMLSEDDVLDHHTSEMIGSYELSMARPLVKEDDHLFTVMSMVSQYELTAIAVVDDHDNYLGIITQDDLIRYYANSFSFSEPGSILVLEMAKQDYALSQLSQIVESEGASILSSYVTTRPESKDVEVTIKVNVNDIGKIVKSLQRYEIYIKASFTQDAYYDDLKARYDQLMSYLNV